MRTRYLTYLPALALAWSIAGCFMPSTMAHKPRTFGEIDDKIVVDMKQEGLSQSKPYYLNEINTRVLRAFMATYWNATNPQWVKYAEGFVVYFKSDSIQHRVYYDNTGGRQCTIRQYSEKNLPREIRHMVKSVFYDYSIYLIDEVTVDDKTSYVIKIEDKTSLKEIKIEDGEMEVTHEFIKSK
jgi:hypothetical protein